MADREEIDPRKELEDLGFEIVYKPHEEVAEYIAFYRVEYRGEEISCPVAKRWDVPMGQIWVTEKMKPYERYVLYHELNEIKYRARGYDGPEAHQKALEDDKVWKGDPRWEKMRREINVTTEEDICRLPRFGEKIFKRIMDDRPYFDMKELKEVAYIGEKRFNRLKEEFWCF